MATKRPRTTISFDFDEYKELKIWADSEFRSIPQLVLVLVKKALIERNKRSSAQVSTPPSEPDSSKLTETQPPPTTKAKRGKESNEAG
ncbi:hypothetical protein [Microcoleus sp. bin38.metabat.b11b12b14.051]|uniref:ribbon-helix-helix domain-containing protein n=1 Tax=Microcoleus sp. bin38.metabat.b11b12b14.051 TaxID=2742709 RepID=UPI0025DA7A03|nr:hypothetical protein [Microcoleus sp. bin38.metabat.b11b12b14.051]